MKRTKGCQLIKWLCVMLIGVLFFTQEVSAETSLPPGLIIGDTDGFYVDGEGDYFIHLEDVMPGDTFTKEIVIRNVDLKEGFDIRLMVRDGESSGPIDFRKVVDLELKQEDKVIYEGGLLGSSTFDWTKDQLDLGHFKSGDESTISATFTVSEELGLEDYKEPSDYEFYWSFMAKTEGTTQTTETTKTTTDSTDKRKDDKKSPIRLLPKTGEEWENLLYRVCAGLFILVLVFLIVKKRRQSRKDDE